MDNEVGTVHFCAVRWRFVAVGLALEPAQMSRARHGLGKQGGDARLQAGFSLIETLVMLLVSSVTAVVLLQSLWVAAQSGARIEQFLAGAFDRNFRIEMLRASVEGLQPTYWDEVDIMKGDAASLSGLTIKGVRRDNGLHEFRIRLEERGADTRLVYTENGRDVFEFEMPYESMQIAYWSSFSGWVDEWPTQARPVLHDPYYIPTPDLVVLRSGGADVAALPVGGAAPPPIRERDISRVMP